MGYFLFCLRRSNHLLENFRFMLGQVGQYLAIDLDAGDTERGDEFAVVHSLGANGGVDLDGPELPEGALLFLASSEGVAPCVKQRFLGSALFRLAAPLETLGVFKGFFAVLMGIYSSFYAWHGGSESAINCSKLS